MAGSLLIYSFFFFNDTATTEIYTLSLHDALPIFGIPLLLHSFWTVLMFYAVTAVVLGVVLSVDLGGRRIIRSEEHTSELQSRPHLVCRLLLEKKKNIVNSRS